MLALPRVPVSPAGSSTIDVHSANPPSMRGPWGMSPTYPMARTLGRSRSVTTAFVARTASVGRRAPNVLPVPGEKSPTTTYVAVAPSARVSGGKSNTTSEEVGVWALSTRPVWSSSRRDVVTPGDAVPIVRIVTESNVTERSAAEAVMFRRGTFDPETSSGTVDCCTTSKLPTLRPTATSPASSWPSHDCIAAEAVTRDAAAATEIHSASTSMRGPRTAAGIDVGLIQPFQSRGFRFASNSQSRLSRITPASPDISIRRSAPSPSMR